jgi:hypothetical protein
MSGKLERAERPAGATGAGKRQKLAAFLLGRAPLQITNDVVHMRPERRPAALENRELLQVTTQLPRRLGDRRAAKPPR